MSSLKYLLAIVACLCVSPLLADDTDLGKKMDQVLAELQRIRVLLEASAPRPPEDLSTPIRLDVSGAPALGSANAPVTVVEFMDFQCTFCKRFHAQTFPELKRLYIDTGKVKFYSMDFPLDIHPQALLAAQAGRCAAEQNRFWDMHDLMESENSTLDHDKLMALAERAHVKPEAFEECLSSGKYKQVIEEGLTKFSASGIRATPTFVVGHTTADGVDGELILGAVPLGALQRKIDPIAGLP